MQIWIAITVYVLAALVKKRLHLERSLHEILHILSATVFEKVPLLEALTKVDPKITVIIRATYRNHSTFNRTVLVEDELGTSPFNEPR